MLAVPSIFTVSLAPAIETTPSVAFVMVSPFCSVRTPAELMLVVAVEPNAALVKTERLVVEALFVVNI